MTTIRRDAETTAADAEPDAAAAPPARRGIVFWVVRYLPAEIVGTVAMILAGWGVTFWTDNDALIALAALGGEIFGFYVVVGVTVAIEQARLGQRRVIARTLLLLLAEFGAAELIDTFLIRPAALIAGVWLLQNPIIGLLAGKLVADAVFYAIAAGAFTITDRTGLRRRSPAEPKGQTVP